MARHLLLLFIVCCTTITGLSAQEDTDSTVVLELQPIQQDQPRFPLEAYQVETDERGIFFRTERGEGLSTLTINGTPSDLVFSGGQARLDTEIDHKGRLFLFDNGNTHRLFHIAKRADNSYRIRHIPLWLSILPPLIAIFLALIFREVIASLFIGIWAGAFVAGGLRFDSMYYALISLYDVITTYVITALADIDHMSIIVFSLLIGGMVAIISRNGGMVGVVNRLSRYAKTPRSTQFVTWLLGVAIFFDDYANTLIVGNTMRSVTDRFRISREKLAYIVDSTAAPVAAIAFVTTWIGAELSYIDEGMQLLVGFDEDLTPYSVFIESLKYSFYPILTLLFILFLIYNNRDFGPMLKAERRARSTGQVSPPSSSDEDKAEIEDLSPITSAPLRSRNAIIPVLTVIIVTLFGLIDTGLAATYGDLVANGTAPPTDGWGATWGAMPTILTDGDGFFLRIGKIIGSSNSYTALLYASFSGVLVALLLTIGQRIMSLERTIGTMATGFKTMLPAVMILTLAWSLAATTHELHTATFLTGVLQGNLSPLLLPPIIFILAAVISFSTGSSWSTMAILYPIAIPTTWAICLAQGLDSDFSHELLFNVISIVLGASVMGDHCSPISDTTILSSLASDCNHIEHVRTQLPYALVVGGVSIALVTIAGFLGGGWFLNLVLLLIGAGTLFAITRFIGKPVEE